MPREQHEPRTSFTRFLGPINKDTEACSLRQGQSEAAPIQRSEPGPQKDSMAKHRVPKNLAKDDHRIATANTVPQHCLREAIPRYLVSPTRHEAGKVPPLTWPVFVKGASVLKVL